MVVKRVRKTRRVIRGKGIKSFFRGVWRGIKKTANTINDSLKKTKIISKLAPIVGNMTGNPVIGATVGQTSSQLGYGRRRRVRRRVKRVVRGAGLFQKLKNVISRVKPYASRLNNHLKSSKWISNELKTRGYNNASKIAHSFGYGGRKKRVVRRKKVVRKTGRGRPMGSLGNARKSSSSRLKF